MNFKNFIGIDVSKGTIDIALVRESTANSIVSTQFGNDFKGMVNLEEFIKKQGLIMNETLFCMEHTGIYCRLLSHYLVESKYHVW